MAWFAFFLTFVIWFNHAPLLGSIKETFQLSAQQVKALMILNVALTIPAYLFQNYNIYRVNKESFTTGEPLGHQVNQRRQHGPVRSHGVVVASDQRSLRGHRGWSQFR